LVVLHLAYCSAMHIEKGRLLRRNKTCMGK
jgi:hypothetical protein